MQYEEKSVLVDGKQISYLDVGEGPVILFIHGLYSVKESFWGLMGYIPNYRLIALDLPGSGKSEYDPECLFLPNFASKVFRFSNEIGIKPIMLFGSSMGATISLELVSKDLIRPGTLVLQAPMIDSKQIKWYFKNLFIRILLKLSLRSDRFQKICERIAIWGYKREIKPLQNIPEHLQLSEFVLKRSIMSNWIVFVKVILNMMASNYSSAIENTITPTTILQPDKDTFLNEFYNTENFRVRRIEGRHSIMATNWEDVAQEIQNVIDDIKRQLEVG